METHMNTWKMACMMVVGALGWGTAGADTILVDFGTVAGRHSVGAPDSNGNTWDYITGATDNNTDLVGTDGLVTTIDLALSGFTGGGPGTYNTGLTPSPTLNGGLFAFNAVTDDAIFFTATDAPVLTLSGLDPLATYDLVFYGSRVTTIERWTTYAVGANSAELQTSGSSLSGNWNSSSVITLSGLAPDVNNQIVVTLSANTASGGSGSSTFGYINAMQITVVPEPATLLFMATGIATLWARRRLGQRR
jgi:hypothetical protein